jgi:hypothetical protein
MSKHTPDDNSTQTGTAVAEPAKAETNPDVSQFAERFGKRNRVTVPDPFGIATDLLAGVRLFESKHDGQMAISFDEKPSEAVLEMIKDAGYRWKPAQKVWAHPVKRESAMSTRIEAEQLYQEVRHLIRHEKGMEAEQELPF